MITSPSDTPLPARAARRAVFVLCSWLALVGSAGRAQTTTAAPEVPAKDEIVMMSDFNVNADTQTGYVASESMTGSRIPTKIKDLPFPIEVITSEFTDDFLVFDNSQIVAGGMVTGDQDSGSGYTIRGIASSGQLYNGFWQPAGIPVPNALRDRTELISGPSAGVYGQTSPGGMINIVSKQPKFTPSESFRFSAGSYNLLDARLETTGPLSAKTAYLVVFDDNQRSFNQPWHKDRSRSEAFSLVHKFDDSSDLKIELVADNQRNSSPSNRVPYLFNSKTSTYYGWAYQLMDVSGTGPDSYKNNDNYSSFVTYEKRLNDVFSLRLGSNLWSYDSRSFNTTDTTSYDPDPTHAGTNLYSTPFYGITRLRSSSSSFSAPSLQKDNRWGGGTQGDFLSHYKLFNGAADNRTLLTFDYSTYDEYVAKIGQPQSVKVGSNNLPTLSATGAPSVNNATDPAIIPSAPRFAGDTNYWLPVALPLGPQFYNDPTTGLPINIYNIPGPASGLYALKTWQKTRRDLFGTMFRDQVTLWDKLLLFGTLRFDNVMYNIETKTYPNYSLATYPSLASYVQSAFPGDGKTTGFVGSVAHYHSTAFTGSAGTNYRITPGLSAYANFSTSFVPSTQIVTGATNGQSFALPNEKAKGGDYGLKGSYLGDRLTFTAGGYYVYQYNVSVTANDDNGLSVKEAVGDVVSKGIVFDANYQIVSNWDVNTGYYHTNSKWVSDGSDLDEVGRNHADVPADILTFASKYSFTGALKGFSTFGLFQYIGPSNAEERGNTTATVNGLSITPVGSNNGLREIILPHVNLIGLGAAYEFRGLWFSRRVTQRIQFNVGNLLNHAYVTLSRGSGDGRTYDLSYQILL